MGQAILEFTLEFQQTEGVICVLCRGIARMHRKHLKEVVVQNDVIYKKPIVKIVHNGHKALRT